MNKLSFAIVILIVAAFIALDVRAQVAPPATKGKCYPNFMENCVSACQKGGGVTSGCPKWCASEMAIRGCK